MARVQQQLGEENSEGRSALFVGPHSATFRGAARQKHTSMALSDTLSPAAIHGSTGVKSLMLFVEKGSPLHCAGQQIRVLNTCEALCQSSYASARCSILTSCSGAPITHCCLSKWSL